MAYKRPIRLTNPFIQLSNDEPTTPVVVDLTCYARGVHLVGEDDDAAATFCDPLGFMYVLTIDLLQSLGADGLHGLLTSLGGPGTLVTWEFAFTPDAESVDNPHWSGSSRLPAWAIVDAGINETTEINLEMDVIGDVVETPVPAALQARATVAA